MLSNLTCVLIYKLTSIFFLRKFSVFKRFVHYTLVSSSGISVESYMLYYPVNNNLRMVLKTVVLKIFAIFAEKCPSESLLKEVTLCKVSISFERSTTLNMIS